MNFQDPGTLHKVSRTFEMTKNFISHGGVARLLTLPAVASNQRVTTSLPTLDGTAPGLFNNTLVIYILGDNGASAEGFHGTIDELLTENSLPNTAKQQIEVRWVNVGCNGWGDDIFFWVGNLQVSKTTAVGTF